GGSGLADETNTNGAVTLESDVEIAGNATFWSTIDGAQALSLAGDAEFHGGVDIASLNVDGATTIDNAGNINTTGDQTYNGAVDLTGTNALTAGGQLTANSAITSTDGDLSLHGDAGVTVQG